MIDEMVLLIIWVCGSAVFAVWGAFGIVRTQRIGLALLCTYCLSQPLSWTLLVIGNGGGSVVTPVPDLIAIYLFIIGVVEYRVEARSINTCIPPSPISSLVAFGLMFFIAQFSKRVAYYRLFRKVDSQG